MNGYEFDATNEEVEDFAVRVVAEKLGHDAIAEWLKNSAHKQ
jgi:prophage maintenance system killer protein